MESYKKITISKTRDNTIEETEDIVAVEKKVRIAVNGKNVLNLYCTPLMIREFVVGIIYNEGLISGEWCADRISIEYGDEIEVDIPSAGVVSEGEKTVTSGCAGGVSLLRGLPEKIAADGVSFSLEAVRNIFREFQRRSEIYRITGGVHSAAVTDGAILLAFAEDIGRHNAVDKIIGFSILENIVLQDKIMLASGRLSSEIALKCARCGIPVLVSRAAPTSLAVEIAEKTGLTMIGFARGDKMNIYTGRHRITT
ncbi:MAG: formate dehydrogenase accessory sulfurtransferase FdhD [Nitrospirae bacterium]|nr:MAG: formate dehydrogenase accessory sulfurtransferase FdhD [Nitrospirota bacterium]